jgi:TPR repeat protein
VEYGLRVFERDRPQTIAAWLDAFAGGEIPAPSRQSAHFPPPSGDDDNRTIVAGAPPGAARQAPAKAQARPSRRRYALAAGVAAVLVAGGVGAYVGLGSDSAPGDRTNRIADKDTGKKVPLPEGREAMEKAVTDARAAYAKAETPEAKQAAFEKVILAETELARFLFQRYGEEGKAATRRATELYQKGDAQAAVKEALEGAKYGDPNAMNLLGVAYEEGKGIDKDLGLSTYWFRRAAELGDEFAQANLAIHYYQGLGVDKDAKLAYRWAARAAVRHHVDAQYLLGVLYEKGEGTERDYAKALDWYEAAAKQGDRAAMFAVGRFYQNGLGGDRDLAKAVAFYKQAAEKGHPDAKRALETLQEERKKVERKPQ